MREKCYVQNTTYTRAKCYQSNKICFKFLVLSTVKTRLIRQIDKNIMKQYNLTYNQQICYTFTITTFMEWFIQSNECNNRLLPTILSEHNNLEGWRGLIKVSGRERSSNVTYQVLRSDLTREGQRNVMQRR